VELLKLGRQFRLSPQAKLVLGRDEADNDRLEALAPAELLKLLCRDVNGPLGVLCGQPSAEDVALAAGIVASYGQARTAALVAVSVLRQGVEIDVLQVAPLSRETVQQWQMI
jgi:hypothetical protein